MESVNAEITTGETKFASNTVTLEERQHMIAEAAYFRAEHRGFKGGNPEQDWLEAEMQIDKVFHVIY
jgi:hypothetical protein